MTLGAAVKTCFGKYFTFSGRASRSEYWYFFLFVVIVGAIAGLLDLFLFADRYLDSETDRIVMTAWGKPISAVAALGMFFPHFAAAWRRMHDTGRSGIFVFLPSFVSFSALLVAGFGLGLADMATGKLDSFLTGATLFLLIPLLILGLLSPLIVFFWLSRPSQPGSNPYGPNPQEVTK